MMKYIKVKILWVALICPVVCVLSFTSLAQSPGTAPDDGGFALLVDVSVYEGASFPSLPSKGRGVNEVKYALQSVGGFPENQVQVIAAGNATREGIMTALGSVMKQAKGIEDVRFFLYLKGRSLSIQGKTYFLPHDAKRNAPSTYIGLDELRNWWAGMRFDRAYMKTYVLALWDTDAQGEDEFSLKMAGILRDELTDADGDRNVPYSEFRTRIMEPSVQRGGLQISSDSDISQGGTGVLMQLPSVLEVTSQPSGASILLDGSERGVTPGRISGLASGTYRLQIREERYHIPDGQTVRIARDRGQRVVIPTYQLTPIKVHGRLQGAGGEAMSDAEVRIRGTEYQQKAGDDGKFSFENWQAYGLLELGKVYELTAQSFDGMYSGRASFTFGGMEDISLNISLLQSNWVEIAEQRLMAGDTAAAMNILSSANIDQESGVISQMLRNLKREVALDFRKAVEERLKNQPDDPGLRFMAAELADIAGDASTARNHWIVVKEKTPEDSEMHRRAAAYLEEVPPTRKLWLMTLRSWLVLIIVIGAAVCLSILVFVGIKIRKWVRFRSFREIPNPYIAGKPISEKDMFFGREDIFNFIKSKFSHAAKDITIVLHGGRRTGKTSIMYQIANGRLGDEFIPVFIDMQEMPGVDEHDFFRIVAQKVSDVHRAKIELPEADRRTLDALCRDLEDKSRSAYRSFDDFLATAAVTLEDRYLLFLIDEYEILESKIQQGALTDDILTYLRNLMGNVSNLAFIFAGSGDFAKRARKEWSLTFNMAQTKEVSFLSRENAIALITEPAKDYLRYTRGAVDRILRLTAGHPFFVQLMCLEIIDDLNDRQENRVNVDHVNQACQDIVENAPLHLAFLWSELLPDEKIVISLLAEIITDEAAHASVEDILSRQPHYELEYDRVTVSKSLARLSEDHLVDRDPGAESYSFRMDLIRSWIQAEHPTWGVLKEVQSSD